MKVSSKPISSPSRTEKYPPPPLMMRFLRTNVGSRSRGRSRSSPMFVRKKNASAVIETQEPSSPKVTCIGQVRVRRSSKKSNSKSGRSKTPAKRQRPCWCVKKTLFYSRKVKPRSFRPVWRKWVCLFRFGYCRKVNMREDSSNRRGEYEAATKTGDKNQYLDEEESESAREKEEAAEVFISSTPPKNALLLTRCRSAPYRSSSLASRFWGSPLRTTSETGDEAEKGLEKQEEERESERPILEIEPNSEDSMAERKIDQESEGNLGISKAFQGTINGKSGEGNAREMKAMEGGAARPLILTRCKSEPARTGERLNLQANIWGGRRLGFAEPFPPHNC